MGIRGPQHTALAHIETPISESGGAECSALSSNPDLNSNQEQLDPQLEQILRFWDTLPEHIKLSIHALVSSSTHGVPS